VPGAAGLFVHHQRGEGGHPQQVGHAGGDTASTHLQTALAQHEQMGAALLATRTRRDLDALR
jgi:hypothetical protein